MRRPKVALLVFILANAQGGSQVGAEPAVLRADSSGILWNGFYLGAHLGYAWGSNDWTVSDLGSQVALASGSFSLFQPFDLFTEAGSYNGGMQVGYNFPIAKRIIAGIEADVSYPAWPSLAGTTIGGQSTFVTAAHGLQAFSENVVHAGSLRARLGYAPGNTFYYATGGLAWTRDAVSMTSVAAGISEQRSLTRYGWTAGVGVEVPIIPQWTGKIEYLFTQYPQTSVAFPKFGQMVESEIAEQQLRLGLNYQFSACLSP